MGPHLCCKRSAILRCGRITSDAMLEKNAHYAKSLRVFEASFWPKRATIAEGSGPRAKSHTLLSYQVSTSKAFPTTVI